MYHILNQVDNTEDLKKLNILEKQELAKDLRELVIDTVSKTGGHLASNLGVVEITIALHSVFNTPKDKIVWDVGHQTYIHKILTGRKNKISTLRSLNGLAGFPKAVESEYDAFDTGHSSTSISAALGMARARDIKGEKNSVIAVIGDGALTGGMAFEALNDAGSSNTNLIVILNDNEMSISKNVGGLSTFLTRIRTRKSYNKSNNYIKRITLRIPFIGKKIVRLVRKIKYSIKQLFLPNMFFEDIGFKYLGPVDGHNIEKLEEILEKAKSLSGPILIHVITKKGKGYEPAEKNPDKFHATSAFNKENGKSLKQKKDDYSKIFGDELVKIAKKNDKIVAITAAMRDGTGLTNFAKEFPNRFFDVAIAEQHALTMAAGMAKEGLIPVVSIYSSFYQRAYDQIIHDICTQKLHVVMCIDRAGVVGNDGETHQGMFDLAFLNIIPNITIMAPKDFIELRQMLEFAVNYNGPIAIRYPRGGEEKTKFLTHKSIEKGKAEILKEGADVSIIAIGKMVAKAQNIAEILENKGIDAEVINARFIKPLDKETIIKSIEKTENVITIEDGTIEGGLGTVIEELILEENLKNVKFKKFGYPDRFIKHGKTEEIEDIFGLTEKNIVEYVEKCNEKVVDRVNALVIQ